jgi:hypothetical protein
MEGIQGMSLTKKIIGKQKINTFFQFGGHEKL